MSCLLLRLFSCGKTASSLEFFQENLDANVLTEKAGEYDSSFDRSLGGEFSATGIQQNEKCMKEKPFFALQLDFFQTYIHLFLTFHY